MNYSYIRADAGEGGVRYTGKPDEIVRFIIKNQLLDKNAWEHFALAYKEALDTDDGGWRGEYFGKMMRGACLTYMYTGDEELYNILCEAAENMLEVQDSLGRFSTYRPEKEFWGWDMWCRKYILVGFQYFYDICRDEDLKERILVALKRHADYICEKIGDGENQMPITKSSHCWLGVNSCTILEPVVRLYDMTKNQRYLEFARYIIGTGGMNHESGLIDLALENKLKPFEYPQKKAYETMSFFEGVLAYYEISGTERYLTAVKNFVEAVNETDITVIGCAGCVHELFDNSALTQTEPAKQDVMQETCVTVTWMRLLARLHLLTGEAKYAERIEKSALNALYGAVNTHLELQNAYDSKVGPFIFDSYSPLFNDARGRGVGGYKKFEDGFSYGCCVCIGSAGTALFPLVSALSAPDGIVINNLVPGKIKTELPSENIAEIEISEGYPVGGEISVRINLAKSERFTLKIRVPETANVFKVSFGTKELRAKNGYVSLTQEFAGGDVINVKLENKLSEIKLNGKTAFKYGALTLCRDSAKQEGKADLTEEVVLKRRCGKPIYTLLKAQEGETVRIAFERKDGTQLLLSDYASCGKKWNGEKNLITVWMNVK